MLAVISAIGAVAAPLGAGYIERAPIWLLPFICYSFVTRMGVRKPARQRVITLITAVAIIVMLIGISFYFSGRNFQSVCYSSRVYKFILDHDPNKVALVYTSIQVTRIQTAHRLLMEGKSAPRLNSHREALRN